MSFAKKFNFSESLEGQEVKQQLLKMVSDSLYRTEPGYSSKTDLYPDNRIPFVDKHMEYLGNHPMTNPQHYLSNLRLITRIH
jgi:hypothetical protein